MMRTPLVICVCVLLLLSHAAADDKPAEKPKPLTPEQAADEVLEAFKAEDEAALKALATKDDPDPWLVADVLCGRRACEAARAYARAAPRKDLDALPAYVEGQRGKEPDRATRQALEAQLAALRQGNGTRALEAAAGIPTHLDTLPGIRLRYRQAYALQVLGRLEESAEMFLGVAEAAERIGWLTGAAAAFQGGAVGANLRSDFRGARLAWERRLALEESRDHRSGMAESLSGLGSTYQSTGDYAKALRLQERCLALREAAADPAGVAATLGQIGNLHRDLGDYPKALGYQQKALPIYEGRGDRAGVAATLVNIGTIYDLTGNNAAALQFYERGLGEAEAVGHDRWTASARANIGNIHSNLGNYAKALQYYADALHLMQKLGNRAAAASLLGNMGNLHFNRGDLAKALEFQEESLAASEALGDRPGAALTLGNLGHVHQGLGDCAKAKACFEQSLRRQETLGDRAGMAAALGALGNVCFSLGDYATALRHMEHSLELERTLGNRSGIARQLAGLGVVLDGLGKHRLAQHYLNEALTVSLETGDRPGAAARLGNIGLSHARTGDTEKALDAQERSLELFEELGDRRGMATALGHISTIYILRGDFPRALRYQERALAIAEAIGDRAGSARALENIGVIREGLGEFDRARDCHQRALDQARDLGATEIALYALTGLAQVHRILGDPSEAVRVARVGVRELELFSTGLDDAQETGARERFHYLFARGLHAGLASESAEDVCYFLESGRASLLRTALGARETLRSVAIPKALRAEEARARLALDRAGNALRKAAAGSSLKAIRTTRTAYASAQERIEEIVGRIQRESKHGASIAYPTVDGLAEIQARLAPSDVLVLYGLTDADGAALVLSRTSARTVTLGDSSLLAGAVEDFDASDREHPTAAGIEKLRSLLVEPLKLEGSTTRVLLSPTGRLGYLPFALLMPDREVVYVPSGTTHGVLLEDREKRGEKILALGDPDYRAAVREQDVAVTRASAPRRLLPLPATREEATAIADTVLLGEEATESGLVAALEKQDRWRAVHFACHGLVDPDRPQLSSLALTADGESDGLLTCLEVFRMRLPADLVVLSACETGKGRIYRTEGIVGLTRAFMFAGAPRVICSLWKVDDAATQALMVKFYELWNPKEGKGLGAAAALRKAQDFVKSHEEWEHPYYWGAWVLWGLPN